jgi:uncharacterized protein YijF (DUF1287 family)
MRLRPPAPRHVTPPATTRRAGRFASSSSALPCFALIGLVTDVRTASGVPLVIHNIGAGTRMEDRLFAFPITGHYRYPAARQDNSR